MTPELPHKTPSVEPVLRSRLLPRISFRFVMGLTFLVACVASMARVAGDGGAFARAIIASVIFVVACFVVFVFFFALSWVVSAIGFRNDDETTLKGSPFAEGQLPPQILPPRENQT